MQTFEMKTHRSGRTYTQPHFFILNKGLNSGKPLKTACPNCFVVTTPTTADKETIFMLCMMLQIAGFYTYYLKGSVIPFISINDCLQVLKQGLDNSTRQDQDLKKQVEILSAINQKQIQLQSTLSKLTDLKKAYIQAYFKSR
ncbi:hypothetical protein GSB9_00435 [Flavobacteriaceae bacterium GSB9]|nr:hypothetical protein GSB9_00435 [Flavobacteriaceae bacterium GSB9]